MAVNVARIPTLSLADTIELYHDMLEQSKVMDQEVRLVRDRILRALASQRIDQIQSDGYEAIRQLRHHPPQLNEDRATEILREHGRLQECQVQVLDQEKARQAIEELFRHGALSKDELPYVYVKPTEALIVRRMGTAAEEIEEAGRVPRAA